MLLLPISITHPGYFCPHPAVAIERTTFLLVIDPYSKWVEIFETKECSLNFVITKVRKLFSRLGLLKVVVSDGRQTVSEDFLRSRNLIIAGE